MVRRPPLLDLTHYRKPSAVTWLLETQLPRPRLGEVAIADAHLDVLRRTACRRRFAQQFHTAPKRVEGS